MCVVLRYGFGRCAEEGQEQRKALAGPGDSSRGMLLRDAKGMLALVALLSACCSEAS